MAWVRVGRLSGIEAELVKVALAAEGIEAVLLGGARSALQGALPASETLVEVQVEEANAPRAQKVISAFFAEEDDGRELRCTSCGNVSPASFGLCWSCEAPLTQAPVAPAPTPGAVVKAPDRFPVFTVLFGVTTAVLAALLWVERQRPTMVEGPHLTWEGAGPCVIAKLDGRKLQVLCDRNGDENFEEAEQFDKQGRLVSRSLDSDEDGAFEELQSFDTKGVMMGRERDVDRDWRFDSSEAFDVSGTRTDALSDLNHDGRLDERPSAPAR